MIEEIDSQSEDTDDSVTSTTHFATRPTDEEMSHLFETLSLTGAKPAICLLLHLIQMIMYPDLRLVLSPCH